MIKDIYSLFSLIVFAGILSVNAQASSPSDYFQSASNGNWDVPSTWTSSANPAGPFTTATIAPTFASAAITIRSEDTVTLNDIRLIDQVTVNGTLVVNPNVYVELNDGVGTDLIIAAGGKLILRSNATGSAGVDNLQKYSASGTATIEQHNNVVQERYFNALRSWRLITAPLRSSASNVSIYESWQNNGQYQLGRGTLVTAPGGTTAEGIDAKSGYSLKSFNSSPLSQSLQSISNTKTTPLFTTATTAANNSYFVFVRGDRSTSNLTIPNKNTTTLSAMGELQIGQQSFSASPVAGNVTLIGNPYASLVDFSKVSKNNIYDRFYAFDPTLGETGGYTVIDRPQGQTLYSPAVPSSQQTSIIQINQAIFVETVSNSAAASIVFNENSKTTVNNTTSVFRTDESKMPSFKSDLYGVYDDKSVKLFDGNKAVFKSDFSALIDRKEDALKMMNFNENLGLVRNGVALSIEKRPMINGTDTLFLELRNTKVRSYQLMFTASNFSPNITAFLEDAFLKTSAPVSVSAPDVVSFSVTPDAASADPKRFRIIFKGKPVPAIDLLNAQADISVYPNPVKGKVITLQGCNLPEGTYHVELYNMLGQQLLSKTFQHPGGTFTQTLQLNKGVSKGTYQLKITNGKNQIHKQFMCD